MHNAQRAKKKKNRKKLFSPYKIIDSENFIKVSQNPNKVARDTQGLPTVPHNDFGGLNFKGLASKYLLLMATSPYKITFSKKNHEKNLLESEKTSNSALSGVVRIEIWSSFWFCVSSFWVTALHVNEPACPILLYPKKKVKKIGSATQFSKPWKTLPACRFLHRIDTLGRPVQNGAKKIDLTNVGCNRQSIYRILATFAICGCITCTYRRC